MTCHSKCPNCGSTKLLTFAIINYNTEDVVEWSEHQEVWCADCGLELEPDELEQPDKRTPQPG